MQLKLFRCQNCGRIRFRRPPKVAYGVWPLCKCNIHLDASEIISVREALLRKLHLWGLFGPRAAREKEGRERGRAKTTRARRDKELRQAIQKDEKPCREVFRCDCSGQLAHDGNYCQHLYGCQMFDLMLREHHEPHCVRAPGQMVLLSTKDGRAISTSPCKCPENRLAPLESHVEDLK